MYRIPDWWLTPRSRVLLEKLTGPQLDNFPAFYGTRRSITAITSARHLSVSWASSIQSIPQHSTSWRSILTLILPTSRILWALNNASRWQLGFNSVFKGLILSSHLLLCLPSGLFPPVFPTKTLCMPILAPIRATCPANLILLYFITRTIFGEQYISLSSSVCSFLHSPVTSSLLDPNIPLSTLFSNTPSLRSCESHGWWISVYCFVLPASSTHFPDTYNNIRLSQWPLGLRRRSAAARLLRSWVRIPPTAWMFVVSVVCFQVEVI